MSRRRVAVTLTCLVLVAFGYLAYRVAQTARSIPEAYAARDAGTILVAYMQDNDGSWPTGWNELESFVLEHKPVLRLRGDTYPPPDDYQGYLAKLRKMVRIDWSFNPRANATGSPITRPDGAPFPVTWEGADPNDRVRSYLYSREVVE